MRIQVIVAAISVLIGSASMGPNITPSDDGSGYSVTLSPPDRKFHSLDLSECVLKVVDASGNSIDVNVFGTIYRITSDEVYTLPDGDMTIVGSSAATLLAARAGSGDGRVYSILYRVSDTQGNTTAAICRVQVPLNPKTPAIDSGVHECIGSGC